LRFTAATPAAAPAIAALRTATAVALTAQYGYGHWSSCTSESAVLLDLRVPVVSAGWCGERLLATFRLATRRPWAIDPSYFTECRRPLYLTSMAVDPDRQRQGIGRLCIEEAQRLAVAWPADAIRLDAYDAEAGAGGFYAKAGFREVARIAYRGTPLVYYELLL
jgi:ribosomal protein S18 acetylase RimI-like enzyme